MMLKNENTSTSLNTICKDNQIPGCSKGQDSEMGQHQLHVRPVALLCGYQQQQQPIETKEGRTIQAKGILYEKQFYKSCMVFNFLEQHRCSDPSHQEYLNTLKYFKLSAMLLRELQANHVLCTVDPPSDSHISDVLKMHADAVVLTVSRAATYAVNRVAINKLFRDQVRYPDIQYDNDLPPSALYKTMCIMITQNRDKKQSR